MSQRLLIGISENESIYDCVIHNREENVEYKLRKEWLVESDSFFLGPWKIIIKDMHIFIYVNKYLKKIFDFKGYKYPQCIWVFSYKDKSIEHPTQKELDKFIKDFEND